VTEEGLSPIPREARPFQGQPAGLVSRCLANVVDALVVGVVLVVGYVTVNGVMFVLDPQNFAFTDPSLAWTALWALWTTVVYFAGAWMSTGRTYGAHVMGLRVVGRRGRRVRPAIALARALLCVFFPIGLLWCAVSPNRRSLQDIGLRTSVVYDWRPRADKRSKVAGSPAPGEPGAPLPS
jgi:uncharacterized RDD family membrane protein YckC